MNPYQSPKIPSTVPRDVYAKRLDRESALSLLRDEFARRGFTCDVNADLGPVVANLLCTKDNGWFVLPHISRFYLYWLSGPAHLSVKLVRGLHALSRSYTDSLHIVPRGFRIRIPITATVVFSESRIPQDTIAYVQSHKDRYQVGDSNITFVADLQTSLYYCLQRDGSVNLARTRVMMNEMLEQIGLRWCNESPGGRPGPRNG